MQLTPPPLPFFCFSTITDEPRSSSHGAIINGVFRGTIYDREDAYFVEPEALHFEHPQDFHSVIYKGSDVNDPHDTGELGSCGAKKEILKRMQEFAETAEEDEEDEEEV